MHGANSRIPANSRPFPSIRTALFAAECAHTQSIRDHQQAAVERWAAVNEIGRYPVAPVPLCGAPAPLRPLEEPCERPQPAPAPGLERPPAAKPSAVSFAGQFAFGERHRRQASNESALSQASLESAFSLLSAAGAHPASTAPSSLACSPEAPGSSHKAR